jgi:hypothetical protein
MVAKDLTVGPAAKFRIYCGLDGLTEYESLVTSANDNIGRDLDPFHSLTTFRRVPLVYVKQLDDFTIGASATATAPWYGVNHNSFHPFTLRGDWMREGEAMSSVEQHNVATVFMDSSYNYFCKNVKNGGFVMHKTFAS